MTAFSRGQKEALGRHTMVFVDPRAIGRGPIESGPVSPAEARMTLGQRVKQLHRLALEAEVLRCNTGEAAGKGSKNSQIPSSSVDWEFNHSTARRSKKGKQMCSNNHEAARCQIGVDGLSHSGTSSKK